MKLVKFDSVKKDEFQLVRLNKLLSHFLKMIGDVDARIQSTETEETERIILEEDKKFFLEEYSKTKEELDLMLHNLGLDRRGDWILWRGRLRRGLKVISGNRGVGITNRVESCLKLVQK